MPLDGGVDLDALARRTHGFVGADLAALAREAAIDALRRLLPSVGMNGDIPPEMLSGLDVSAADFASAKKRVHPSAMRELLVEVPDVRWEDVGGLEDTKRALRDGIELPLSRPEVFGALGIRPARGFLLVGPPGTGKTRLAKAAAREAEANFIAAKASDLLSKWYGESERQISRLFGRARQVAPAIIFLDEIDSLAPARGNTIGGSGVDDRVVNTLLTEMDGLEGLHGVVVIGATNRPTLLDPALLRPGRFDELVYVPVPDRDGRLHILRIHTARMPLAPDVHLEPIADRTHGYTGADLEGLVRQAGLHAFRLPATGDGRMVSAVPMSCFERALADSRASVTPEMEREYEAVLQELKREAPRGRKIGF
jgi:transitional endoplasmic reticulum ATPase